MTNEEWYDREIAPKLLELSNLCGNRGMSFVSTVEYAPGKRSRTQRLTPSAGLEMNMLALCAASGLNVDGYMIGLIRYCREHNIDTSQSAFLNQSSPDQLSD